MGGFWTFLFVAKGPFLWREKQNKVINKKSSILLASCSSVLRTKF